MGSLVSLVMSDIVDSTRRWNAAEGAMAADLELHDRLVREVVEGAGGSVFKHTGDGMIAMFDDPVAAVGAGAGIQQAIGAAQWQQPDGLRVRIAVHTGVVYPRDGDVFGTAVNRVARLLGACPPGAVLVSGATTGLLTDRAPEGLSLQRVGSIALAGFATPDEAHCVVGAGVVGVTAVTASRVPPRGGELPSIDEELVGRGDELAAIWDALSRARLVTLVGVGGMGKTRLALEVAVGAATAYADGAWWIDLANATTADAVVPVAMTAVGARDAPGRTALQAVCDRFVGVTGVLVVDNCEHVLAGARELVGALRAAAPDMRVVATSREALGLRGEQIVPVGSLPADDGVVLFCERAVAVRPDLDTAGDRAVIERLCARLDGIPLAIELAAARCRSMTPADIDNRLGDRFRLLRGGRDGAERHRTLQAAVAWSYSMLDDDERSVFDQMSVFAGGTLIDGLVAVTGFEEFDVLDIVDRLVARSMVVATRTSLGMRYHQLETLRQYAEDRLVEVGTAGDVRDRHLDWALALAGQIASALGLDAEAAAVARLRAEADNLRVAVAHGLDSGHNESAYQVVALVGTLALLVPMSEVLDWVRRFPNDHQWSTASAACAGLALSADATRGLRFATIGSPDDVPEWYGLLPRMRRAGFVTNHLILGGDVAVALELLDRLHPSTDEERIFVDFARLMAAFFRQLAVPLDESELDDAIELAAATVSTARNANSALGLAWGSMGAAYALVWRRPDLAAPYAHEAFDLAERLGLGVVSGQAEGALALALSNSSGIDVFVTLRDRVVALLERNQLHTAGSMVWSAGTLVARSSPGVMTRLWAVWKREIGVDLQSYLDRASITLPDDLDGLALEVAGLSLADAIGEVVAALDRAITEAGSGGDG